jgi:uncharacterized protein
LAAIKKITSKGKLICRLQHGADLLEEITDICKKQDIRLGRIEAIGAVRKACVGFYDQDRHEYEFISFDRPMEITALIGNVSIKDGFPFVHAHITLADSQGNAHGGHLASGTIVFACELIIEGLEGEILERGFDQQTGLALWTMQDKN